MSLQISSSKLPSSPSMSNHNRPLANFPPNVWGDMFLSSPSQTNVDGADRQQHEELKEEIRKMVKVDKNDDLVHKLRLIDTVRRLAVSYHFEEEIEEALHIIYEHDFKDDQTLEITSLRFRVLRENGFSVPCETFNKFKDGEGNFKKCLTSDVKGLLELYEAAHLNVHSEEILEEALHFATTHLDLAKDTGTIEYPLSALVSHARNRPICRGFQRFEAKRFIGVYQDDDSHDKTLLKFAELDFNLLQNMHKEELSKINRWYKDADFAEKLPFIRDRVVEGYLWILGVYFEPKYAFARYVLTKVIVLTSVMDDIYDAYGTFDELQLLTNAILRWKVDCMDELPEYMRFFYKPLLDFYIELEEEMEKQGKAYRAHYAIVTLKQLAESYLLEAKWLHEKYEPTMEEYMKNAVLTAGYVLLTVTSFVGMEDSVTLEIFEWAYSNPKMIDASSIVCRLMDDIASHKFEQERGHCASAVEVYTREHGVSEEEACTVLRKRVEDAWKTINHEMIFGETSKVIPRSAQIRSLNFTRVIEFLYKDGFDNYTHVGQLTKDAISSLLIDPVRVSTC